MEETSRRGNKREKKSRSPEQLKKLFSLRYVEGVRDKQVLAYRLGVKPSTLRQYYKRICERAYVTPPVTVTYEEALDKSRQFICPECLTMSVMMDGVMRVCSKCGLELGRWDLDESLPFDTTYAPTSSIALGHSLGGTLSKQDTYKVIAKSMTGRKDLGLRARFINIIHEANEPPQLKKLLEYGSQLLKDLDLEDNHVLANLYADHLRAYANGSAVRPSRLAQALLGELLELYLPKKAEEAQSRLRYGEDAREMAEILIKIRAKP